MTTLAARPSVESPHGQRALESVRASRKAAPKPARPGWRIALTFIGVTTLLASFGAASAMYLVDDDRERVQVAQSRCKSVRSGSVDRRENCSLSPRLEEIP